MLCLKTRWPWIGLLAAACAIGMASSSTGSEPTKRPMNVLLIAVDDLRPQLGCYGHTKMVTPNLDRLAAEGRLFEHHYVQVPTCGASRCAMLTGRYPTATAAYENGAFATVPRDEGRQPTSMPEFFRRNGYRTVSIGKISHEPSGHRSDGKLELAHAWDAAGMPSGKWGDAWSAFFAYADGSTRVPKQSQVTERGEVDDKGYPDGLIADEAIAELGRLKNQPFFLAVGFIKPHLPFNAPAKYWDLYDEQTISLAANPSPPKHVDPKISLHNSGEMLGQYAGFATPGQVSHAEARRLRHAYFACVSYVDAQIGRVLNELDRLGLRDDTIVVVWGDHGWHLGEQGIWGKHTLHEVALRSPLLVRTPQMAMAGVPTAGIVEAIDIFPTLAELCGVKPPDTLDGRSFAGQLRDPAAEGKAAAYGFWARGRAHSVRTPEYRLTQWTVADDPTKVAQIELYDHRADLDETVNLAAEHAAVVESLRMQLREHAPLLKQRAQDGER